MSSLILVLIFFILINAGNSYSQDHSFGNEFIWKEPYGVIVKSEKISNKVSQSIGKIFIAKDKIERFEYSNNPNTIVMSDALLNFAISEYDKNIKKLKVEDRVDYLWTVIWQLELGESTYFQVEEIISKDCPDLFIKKLDVVLKYEKNKAKLALAKAFKSHILHLVKTHRVKKGKV